jgi:hypothetical protein
VHSAAGRLGGIVDSTRPLYGSIGRRVDETKQIEGSWAGGAELIGGSAQIVRAPKSFNNGMIGCFADVAWVGGHLELGDVTASFLMGKQNNPRGASLHAIRKSISVSWVRMKHTSFALMV